MNPNNNFSRKLNFILFFALLGTLLFSWVAPQTIAWYFETPVNIGINCRPAAEWAMNKLRWVQLGGAVAGIVLGFMVHSMMNKRNTNPPS